MKRQKLILEGCPCGKYGTKVPSNSTRASDYQVSYSVLDLCADFVVKSVEHCYAFEHFM